VLRKFWIPALAVLAIVGCDSNGSSSGNASTKFTVRYEVTGTFTSACDLFYINRRDDIGPDEENQGGDSRQETSTLPWEYSFDVTVTQLHPFNTQIGAVCSDTADQDVSAVIYIDGVERARDDRTGQNVNAMASYQLIHVN
jgi:hypothetical protein